MAPMFIPRAASSTCSATDISCSPDADTSSGFDPSLMEKRGPHRYIGIAMVAVLILIVFFVWIYRGKWPRKMLQQYCSCCCSEELPNPTVTDDETPPTHSPKKDMGDSDRKLDKEVVPELVPAGMIVFTKIPKALRRAKDNSSAEWETDVNHGIRLETRTPPYHASRQS